MNTPLVSQTISNQPVRCVIKRATVEPSPATSSGPKTRSEHIVGSARFWEKKPLWRPWWKQKTSDRQYDRVTNTLSAKNAQGKEWKQKKERYAHAYELARRHDRDTEWPPYTSADGKELAELLPFWSEPDNSQVARSRELPIQEDGSLWDDENWGPLNVDWHFSVSASKAIEEFKKLFLAEQKRRKLPPEARLGNKRRSLSWRWVELLDEAHFLKSPRHNPDDRSKLSQARKAAKRFHAMLMAVIEDN